MTHDPARIVTFPYWWLQHPGNVVQKYRVIAGRPHKKGVVVRLEGCSDRDLVQGFRGAMVLVPREDLDYGDDDDEEGYLWADLIGCRAVDAAGAPIGKVVSMMETGANDVLVVRDKKGQERLFPFTLEVVPEVDLKARLLTITPLPGM